jgi:uncharacterized repeat protein (TIGR04138 family)
MTYDPSWLSRIVAKDPRFKPAGYQFLFESLEFTRNRLTKERGAKIKHVSGPELLEGVRLLALDNFGRLAQTVFNQWGIYATSDIGDMVFNLIESGEMEKTEDDSHADFENVYDFDEAFQRGYKIEIDET